MRACGEWCFHFADFDERNHERAGLARSGARLRDEILAGQEVGNRLLLHEHGRKPALTADGDAQSVAQLLEGEIGKRRIGFDDVVGIVVVAGLIGGQRRGIEVGGVFVAFDRLVRLVVLCKGGGGFFEIVGRSLGVVVHVLRPVLRH